MIVGVYLSIHPITSRFTKKYMLRYSQTGIEMWCFALNLRYANLCREMLYPYNVPSPNKYLII